MSRIGIGIGIEYNRITDSIDAQAQAFITAAGITDPTQQAAINTLVVSLKSAGLWTKIKALYPFVGGSATSHKFNLLDPRDLDAAYRMQWFGGLTHNANGVTGNGVNGYGNTFLKPDPDFALNDVGVSYLCSNTGVDGNILFGVQDASNNTRLFHYPAFNGSDTNQTHINSSASALPLSARQGFHSVQRVSGTTQNSYRNGSLILSSLVASSARALLNIAFLCYNNNGSLSDFNSSNIRILAFHESLDATQAANLYTIQNAFQTTLGRAV